MIIINAVIAKVERTRTRDLKGRPSAVDIVLSHLPVRLELVTRTRRDTHGDFVQTDGMILTEEIGVPMRNGDVVTMENDRVEVYTIFSGDPSYDLDGKVILWQYEVTAHAAGM